LRQLLGLDLARLVPEVKRHAGATAAFKEARDNRVAVGPIADQCDDVLDEQPMSEISTVAIAREAGVARGLIHHYFGGKRGVYLELVRSMVHLPPPRPRSDEDRPVEEVVGEALNRWLVLVERNRGTWLTSVGGRGIGHDPEVQEILDAARERAAENFLALAGRPSTPQSLATVRAFSAFAEEATLEWLQRGRLDREQVHSLLISTLVHLTRSTDPT
jgi:AcrR family transcriptional regulator